LISTIFENLRKKVITAIELTPLLVSSVMLFMMILFLGYPGPELIFLLLVCPLPRHLLRKPPEEGAAEEERAAD